MHDQLKKSLRTVNYCGFAGVALLLLGTTAFGVYPLWKSGHDDIRGAADLRTTLTRFNGLPETLALKDAERQETELRLKEEEKRLPASLEASEFNAELTEVAKAAGIRVESMPNQENFKDAGGYKALPVTIVGSGDWESCYRFLTGIKGMNRMTRLDSVVMNVLEKGEKALPPATPVCQITVKFSTFFMER